MEDYVDKPYPTKAGVYAVRAGPIIAENIIQYIKQQPLVTYTPQTGFLSLMMTGDGSCIGSKHGMGFVGTWVWKMKDYIDMSFMNLFDRRYLFKDYENQGDKEPIEDFWSVDSESIQHKALVDETKDKIAKMEPAEAAKLMSIPATDVDYLNQFLILQRCQTDLEFREGVVDKFKPPYYIE